MGKYSKSHFIIVEGTLEDGLVHVVIHEPGVTTEFFAESWADLAEKLRREFSLIAEKIADDLMDEKYLECVNECEWSHVERISQGRDQG